MSARPILSLAFFLLAAAAQAQPQIRIDRPFSGERIGNELYIEVALLSSTELQAIRAEVADRDTFLTFNVPVNRFTSTLSLKGLDAGEKSLTVTAIDVNGQEAVEVRSFLKDAPPDLIIERPERRTMQQELHVSARCEDDGTTGCEIQLWMPTCDYSNAGMQLASARSLLDVEIDTTTTGTGLVTLCFAVSDSLHRVHYEGFGVFIEPDLRVIENAPYEIVDVSRKKALVNTSTTSGFQPGLYDLETGALEKISIPDPVEFREHVQNGVIAYALESGAALGAWRSTCPHERIANEDCYRLFVWSMGVVRLGDLFPGYSLRAAGDYVGWNYHGDLFLHHAPTRKTVQIGRGFDAPDVDAQGRAVFAEENGNIYLFDGGITTRVSLGRRFLSPLLGDGIVAYTGTEGDVTALMLHDGASQLELATSTTGWLPKIDFFVSGKWVAFKDENSIGQLLLKLRAPDGSIQTILTLRAGDRLEDLSPEGEVSVRRTTGRYIVGADAQAHRVSSGSGESEWLDRWVITMGRSMAEPANLPSGIDTESTNENTLRQNYPNPFSGITTIDVVLGASQQISLELFDILGRRIQVIATGLFPAGTTQVAFTGADLAPGLYIYRLSAGSSSATRLMSIVK